MVFRLVSIIIIEALETPDNSAYILQQSMTPFISTIIAFALFIENTFTNSTNSFLPGSI